MDYRESWFFFFNSLESWFKLALVLIFSVTKIIFSSEIWYCKVQYADRSEFNDKLGVQNTGLAPWSYKESGKSAFSNFVLSQLRYLIKFVKKLWKINFLSFFSPFFFSGYAP